MNNNYFENDRVAYQRQWEVSSAFPALMRKVYTWMVFALAITGFTAYAVATSPGVLMTIYSNSMVVVGNGNSSTCHCYRSKCCYKQIVAYISYTSVYTIFRHQRSYVL